VGLWDLTLHQRDFLGWARDEKPAQFDAVLGNPPFIRYQYLPSQFQDNAAAIFLRLQCKFTKHTNAWVPFILASMDLLRPGGRLAMVVPAEIVHVMHAQSLRTYLGQVCRRIVIVDPQELWFDGTLQGAVLLMAERKFASDSHSEGLGIYRVNGRHFLSEDPEVLFNAPQAINGKTVEGKWTRALVPPKTIDLLDEVETQPEFYRFSQIADVDVGIVTGANKFFLVPDEVVERYGLHKWAHPMFGRSDHCPGVIYDDAQHERNAEDGKPSNFLWLKGEEVERSKTAREYIKLGEREDLHTRYKCRIRKPWYTVPSVYSTEIGMLKRSHDTPRLILNRANAFTTDTAYRIRIIKGSAEQLVFGFMNSLTALTAELEGRHYGGGVLELVPSEIERMIVPDPEKISADVQKLDRMIRNESIADILEVQSEAVLGGLGFSKDHQMDLLEAWSALRNRRQRLPD